MRKYLPLLPLVLLVFLISFLVYGLAVIEPRRMAEAEQRAYIVLTRRCTATLNLAKTASDTLKYIQADPTCLEFTKAAE